MSNVEQNVDTMIVVIERVKAMMMHMAQSLRAQPPLVAYTTASTNRQGDRHSSCINGGAQQHKEWSP